MRSKKKIKTAQDLLEFLKKIPIKKRKKLTIFIRGLYGSSASDIDYKISDVFDLFEIDTDICTG